jgi:hypothetical protein
VESVPGHPMARVRGVCTILGETISNQLKSKTLGKWETYAECAPISTARRETVTPAPHIAVDVGGTVSTVLRAINRV